MLEMGNPSLWKICCLYFFGKVASLSCGAGQRGWKSWRIRWRLEFGCLNCRERRLNSGRCGCKWLLQAMLIEFPSSSGPHSFPLRDGATLWGVMLIGFEMALLFSSQNCCYPKYFTKHFIFRFLFIKTKDDLIIQSWQRWRCTICSMALIKFKAGGKLLIESMKIHSHLPHSVISSSLSPGEENSPEEFDLICSQGQIHVLWGHWSCPLTFRN